MRIFYVFKYFAHFLPVLCCCVLAAQAICLQNLSLCVSVGPWPECDVFYLRVLWSACEVRPVAATTM